ncbi:MAG: lytic transglycosylase domain-containing protein [Kiloniellales bacterium]|nr:lytic transglycosylase domain-containing protein [Kiloniellales bacterium]
MVLAVALGLLLPALPALAFDGPHTDREWQDGTLSDADIERYRKVFALQAEGAWAEADALVARLENDILLGHVLAQRYLHPTHYRSKYQELAAWLARYADHPDAWRIYRLALKRKPTSAAKPRRPVSVSTSLGAEMPLDTVYLYQSKKKLKRSERRRVQRLKRRIRGYVRRTYLTKTERLLEQAEVRRLFDRFELDEAYSQVAAGWFYYGKPDKALRLAGAVAERSGAAIPTAHWTAGLAAWRLDKLTEAGRHFERLASSSAASAWNRAAGAYWAARVHERGSDPAEAHRWLTVAAQFPFTFYGLLARHRLNLQLDVAFTPLGLDAGANALLLAAPRGRRAAALVAVGRRDLAEQELMALPDWRDPETTRALLAVTQSADLPRLGHEIAQRLLLDEDSGWSQQELAAVLYPVPRWRAEGGFKLDRALIYAFVRQESSFDPRAKSPAGARGLMQLMPRTASALDKRRKYTGRQRDRLYEPELNLALGQRYLDRLLGSRRVAGDLLRLTVAYNAGPGNLGKWQRKMPQGDDPLLFIESLPSLESRLFVERVMANLWIYRERLGQASPTLAALASNRWPIYEALDPPAHQIAASP